MNAGNIRQSRRQDRKLSKARGGLFAVTLASLLSGCATVPLSVLPEQSQQIKKVAVVSILGDDFSLTDIGVTSFQDSRVVRKVPEWNIDAGVELASKQAVETMPQYKVVDIAKERAAILAVTTKRDSPYRGRELKEPDCYSVMKALKDNFDVDALIVISEGELKRFPLTARTPFISGNGIGKEAEIIGLGGGRIALHSTVTVAVYDTKTSKIIARNQGFRWIHVDKALWDNCNIENKLSNINGLDSTVTCMVNAAVCDGLFYLKLGQTPDPKNSTGKGNGLSGGNSPRGRFDKVKCGMTMREVYDLIGQPTGARLYATAKTTFNPYYMGEDRARFDALYRGEGRITFKVGGATELTFAVSDVKQDPNETGVVQISLLSFGEISQPTMGWYGEMELR